MHLNEGNEHFFSYLAKKLTVLFHFYLPLVTLKYVPIHTRALNIKATYGDDNIFTSNRSNESDDVSHAASLDEYINQFIIRDWLCGIKTKILEILKVI